MNMVVNTLPNQQKINLVKEVEYLLTKITSPSRDFSLGGMSVRMIDSRAEYTSLMTSRISSDPMMLRAVIDCDQEALEMKHVMFSYQVSSVVQD